VAEIRALKAVEGGREGGREPLHHRLGAVTWVAALIREQAPGGGAGAVGKRPKGQGAPSIGAARRDDGASAGEVRKPFDDKPGLPDDLAAGKDKGRDLGQRIERSQPQVR